MIRYLLYLLLFLIPIQTVYLLSVPTIGEPVGVWQYGIIGIYGTDVLTAAIIVWTTINAVWKWRMRGLRTKRDYAALLLFVGLLGLTIYSGVALVWAPAQWASVYAIVRLIELVGLIWVMHSISWSWVIGAIMVVAMASIQSMVAWHQFLTHTVFPNIWLGMAEHSSLTLGDSVVESTLRRFLRAYGTLPHPNMLGIYLAIALVLCIGLVWQVRAKWQGYILLVAYINILSGLVLSFSRAAWMAAFVGSGVVMVSLFFLKKRITSSHERHEGFGILMIAMSAIVLGCLTYGLWEPVSTRLGVGGLTRLEERSITERAGSLQEGVEQAKKSFPWGVGLGQYTYVLYRDDIESNEVLPSYAYQPAHMVPLLIVSELGVVGVVCFVSVLLGMIALLIIKIRTAYSLRDIVQVATSLGLLGILFVALMSDHFLWTTHAGTMILAVLIGFVVYKPLKHDTVPMLNAPDMFNTSK